MNMILANGYIDEATSAICFYCMDDPAINQKISLNSCFELQTNAFIAQNGYKCVTGKQVRFNRGKALLALNSNPNFRYLFAAGMTIIPDGFNNGSFLKFSDFYRNYSKDNKNQKHEQFRLKV
jgi:hypothetical protein